MLRTSPARSTMLLILMVALVCTQMMLAPLPNASAETSKEAKERERSRIDDELSELATELEDVDSDLSDTYLALAETELKIPEAQEALEDAKDELAAAEEEDRKVGERLDAAEQEEQDLSGEVDAGKEQISTSDEEVSQASMDAYKGSGGPDPTSVYVGSAKPQDAVDRSMNYRLTLEAQGTQLDGMREEQSVTENAADRLTAVREEIDDLKEESEAAVDRTAEAERKADKAKKKLDDLYEKQNEQADELEVKKDKYKDQQSSLEDRGSTLDTEIEKLAQEERERAERERKAQEKREREEAARKDKARSSGSGSSSSGSGGSSSNGSGSGSSSSGGGSSESGSGWMRPTGGPAGSPFGWRVHPIYGTKKLHAGQDFPVGCGTPVKATESGRVVATTSNSSAGNKLIISHGVHGGTVVTSSYHHLQSFGVSNGQNVSRGQVVAYVGNTGGSTGCHLHWEMHQDGSAVNPLGYTG